MRMQIESSSVEREERVGRGDENFRQKVRNPRLDRALRARHAERAVRAGPNERSVPQDCLGIFAIIFRLGLLPTVQHCSRIRGSRMTSVQALPPIITKSHHPASSPVIKPSANGFRKTVSLENMSGTASSMEQPDNGAPKGSSKQVRENWTHFGDMIQRLLQEPLEFVQYKEKDEIKPEDRYTAINQVARKINGHAAVAPGAVRLERYHQSGWGMAADRLLFASHSPRSVTPNPLLADQEPPHLLHPLQPMQIIPSRPTMTFILKLSMSSGLIRGIIPEPRGCIISETHASPIRSCKS
jgi:hypothetical protein